MRFGWDVLPVFAWIVYTQNGALHLESLPFFECFDSLLHFRKFDKPVAVVGVHLYIFHGAETTEDWAQEFGRIVRLGQVAHEEFAVDSPAVLHVLSFAFEWGVIVSWLGLALADTPAVDVVTLLTG